MILLVRKPILNKIIKILLPSVLLSFAFFSCSDDPSSVGINVLPKKDFIETLMITSEDSSFTQKSKTYTDSLRLNNSDLILLGKHDNVESTALMRFLFFLPDSIKGDILEGSLEILESSMVMRLSYTYGDKANSFDFTVHKINSSWNSLTFDKDSLQYLAYEALDRSSNRIVGDTSVTFDFDKILVDEWLTAFANDEQVEINNGLYFNYTPGSDKVIGFPAISSSTIDYIARLNLIVSVPGSYTDTLVIETTSDVHVILGDLPQGNPENVYAQGGIAIRSNLMIDVSKIPDNTIINKATLRVYYDETDSKIGSRTSDSLGVISLLDYDLNEYNQELFPALMKREESYYTGDITRFVQNWVSTGENNGIQLYLTNEINTINKIALKGSTAADPGKRPYLEVYYTSKN